jgi:hypothetical protein
VDVTNQAQIEAFAKDPLSFDPSDIAKLFNDEPTQEGAAVFNAETELSNQLEQERVANEAAEAAARGEKPVESPTTEAKKDDSAKAEPVPADGEKAEPVQAESEDPEKSVILAKDGKNVIPYSVLAKSRDTEAALRSQLQQMAAKQAALEEQLRTGNPDLSPDLTPIDEETRRDLEENAPTIYKAFQSMEGTIKSLQSRLDGFTQVEQSKAERTVQEAIDSNPKISHVQTNDVDAFNAIAGFDAILRSDAKFADLTLDQRFTKALAMYEAAHGEIKLPVSANGDAKPAVIEDPAIKADKAVKEAASKAGPTTLSDIPGGEPPAKSALEDLENVNAAVLTNQLLGMSNEQFKKYLAQLP